MSSVSIHLDAVLLVRAMSCVLIRELEIVSVCSTVRHMPLPTTQSKIYIICIFLCKFVSFYASFYWCSIYTRVQSFRNIFCSKLIRIRDSERINVTQPIALSKLTCILFTEFFLHQITKLVFIIYW